MNRRQGWFFFIIFLLAFSIYILINFPLQLGLDLKGGSQLTLQLIKEEGNVSKDELDSVKAVLDKRVNNLGVSESNLQTLGSNQLIIELPGEQDPLAAKRIIGKTALLEFRTQLPNTSVDLKNLQFQRTKINNLIEEYDDLIKRKIDKNNFDQIKESLRGIENNINLISNESDLYKKLNDVRKSINTDIAKLFKKTDLSGKDLISAGRRQEQVSNNWEVLLSFNNKGGEKFAQITKSIAGTNKLLAIILDGESISEASVGNQFTKTGITGGSATISGNFNSEEARELEVQLKGGSLPLPIEIIETNTIGAVLGSRNIIKSLYAAILGLIFVGLFMIYNYRLLGFISIVSLIFYGFFNLALYSLIPVTLTLPGIAGLILSIGMAVDANILIFERIRDELKNGNTLIRSIDNGFLRANSSIVDGHITTLISCIVLFVLGTNFVKGFSATLGIGVLISLFTSLSCSKTFLRFITSYQTMRQVKLYMKKLNFKPNLAELDKK
ncbi:MAG: protein translocase subunit SecD [Prochlorococcus sp. SP3034]|nr:protein translocase subunit SecD [Prochlorococcus sp. SP3034]|tara:strand:- start:5257 stop:6750 length:1494 start_codon:yes stop_codon:yes gene_type:complete